MILPLAALVLLAAPAGAQEPSTCGSEVRAWARACDADLDALTCDGGVVVLTARRADLRIELRPSGGPSLRDVGGTAIRPVAEIPDWSAAPEPWRRTVDRLAACLERGPPPTIEGRAAGTGSRVPALPAAPWRGIAGLAAVIAVLASQRRRLRAAGPPGLLAAIPVASWLARRAITGPDFFHQNGQGPLWIDMALCQPSTYGPGHREVFQLAAIAGGAAAESGVFLLQSVLAALVPLAAFLLVRAARGSLPLAIALAALAACDPIAARIAQSESYYASAGTLIALACVALAWGALGSRRATLALGTIAAGLCIAQAARIHPLAWLPSALAPLTIAVLPGPWRRRVVEALAAGLGIAIVVLLVSGPALLAMLEGPLFAHWSGSSARSWASIGLRWEWVAPALVVLVARDRPRAAIAAIAMGLVGVAIDRLGVFGAWPAPIEAAALRLHAAPLAIAVVSASTAIAGPWPARVTQGALVLATAGWLALQAPAVLARPTDVAEQRIALGWRAALSPDDTVVYVHRAGDRVLVLPFYQCAPGQPRTVLLRAGEPIPELRPPGRLFVARTSLCATEEGRAACDALDARHARIAVHRRTLAARASLIHLPMRSDAPIEIVLWRASGDPGRPP